MALDQRYIEELVFKFQQGTIDPDELRVLSDWYNNHDDQEVVIPGEISKEQVRQRMLTGLLSRIRSSGDGTHHSKKRPAFPLRWLVAAIALIVGAGAWILWNQHTDISVNSNSSAVIAPGGNHATLTLTGGRTIDLNSEQSGIIVGETIRYVDGTDLMKAGALDQHMEQLKLSTPRGGTYRVTLSDGTQVWLNSASSLSYPARFSSTERVVELTGEAYFDVKELDDTHGKVPFRVVSDQQEIVVLGTEFNISAYPELAYTKTTLVEGKVLIKAEKQAVTLHPGEQATTDGGETSVQATEPRYATAWREGKFSFNGKSFQEIMLEIARWYDLTIVYENGIPEKEIVGDAFRNQDLSLVLRLLDAVSVDYKLDVPRRRLIIRGEKTIKHEY